MAAGRNLKLRVAFCLAVSATLVATASALGTFKPAQDYPVGNGSYDARVGQFLGDKAPDLAVSNRTDGTISFLKGKGNGTFASQKTVNAGSMPLGLAVADFNRDGRSDLVAANQDSPGGITLFYGRKHGPPQKGPSFPTGNETSYAAVADFDGDRKKDVAVSNLGSDSVSVLLGKGKGNLGAAHDLNGLPDVFGLVSGDLNGDGKPDLAAVVDSPSRVAIMYGKGNGKFEPTKFERAGLGLNNLAIAKVNGDSKADLILTDYSGDAVIVLLGKGNGKFGKPHSYPAGISPATVTPLRYDKDKGTDFAVTDADNSAAGKVSILRGKPGGKLRSPRKFGVGNEPYGITKGRLNGDRRDDLVVPSSVDPTVSVLLGR